VVLVIEPRLMPSLKRCLHWEIQETTAGAGLEAYTVDNWLALG
jgi:hypothetical protein